MRQVIRETTNQALNTSPPHYTRLPSTLIDLTLHKDPRALVAALPAQGLSLSDHLEWWFRYLAPDPRASYRFINCFFEDSFPVECGFQTDSGPEHTLPDGRKTLSIVVSLVVNEEPLSIDAASAIIAQLAPAAEKHGVRFLGVGCRRFRVPYGRMRWLTLHNAIWTLRHFADTGQGGAITYVFGFTGPDLPALSQALISLGMTTEFYEPTNEDQTDPSAPPLPPLLLARVVGDGSDNDISRRHDQATRAASLARAEFEGILLEGVQLPE